MRTAFDIAMLQRLAAAQHGLVTAAQAGAVGLSHGRIQGLCRRGTWRPVLAGVYLIEPTLLEVGGWSGLPFEVRLSAGLLAHGRRAIAVLGTAATLHGMDVRDDGVIHLRLPPGSERHQQRGVVLHTRLLPPREVVDVTVSVGNRVRSTSATQTLADLVRSLPRSDAVAVVDSALNGGVLDEARLDDVAALMTGRRGAVDGRRRLHEADRRAQSPLETRIRLIACDAGMPPHQLQLAVRDRHGQLLGYGDLAWLRAGRRTLVAEADGRTWHDSPTALYRDRRRANDFSATGDVDMVRFTWADAERPAYVVSVLRAHLRARS